MRVRISPVKSSCKALVGSHRFVSHLASAGRSAERAWTRRPESTKAAGGAHVVCRSRDLPKLKLRLAHSADRPSAWFRRPTRFARDHRARRPRPCPTRRSVALRRRSGLPLRAPGVHHGECGCSYCTVHNPRHNRAGARISNTFARFVPVRHVADQDSSSRIHTRTVPIGCPNSHRAGITNAYTILMLSRQAFEHRRAQPPSSGGRVANRKFKI